MKRFVVGAMVLAFLLAGVVSAEDKKCCGTCKAKAEVKKACCGTCQKAKAGDHAKGHDEHAKAHGGEHAKKAKAGDHGKGHDEHAKAHGGEHAKHAEHAHAKKAETAKKKAAIKAAHAKKTHAKKPVAKKVDAKTGATPKALKQYATMEKQRLAKITQLLKRIQNIARQEKSEKTVAAIDNAIKRETEAARKRFANRAAAIKKQKAKPAAKKAPAKKKEAHKK